MNQKGFTLVELVIVLAISTVLMLGLMSLFEWHQKVYVLEQADVRAQMGVRNALQNMSKYIAQGTNIQASRTVDGVLRTTGSNALVVEIPSQNSSGEVIAATYDYITYYVDSGALYQVVEPGSGSVRRGNTKQLAEGVDIFSLTYNNGTPASASAVTIDLQTRITTRGTSSVSTRITDTIFLRNQ